MTHSRRVLCALLLPLLVAGGRRSLHAQTAPGVGCAEAPPVEHRARTLSGEAVFVLPQAVAADGSGRTLVLGWPFYVWDPSSTTTQPVVADSTGLGILLDERGTAWAVPRPPGIAMIRDPRAVTLGPNHWLVVLDEPVGLVPGRESRPGDHRLWAVPFKDGRWGEATALDLIRAMPGTFTPELASSLSRRGDTLTFAVVAQDAQVATSRVVVYQHIRGRWTSMRGDSTAAALVADAAARSDGVLVAFAGPDTADLRRLRTVRPSLFVQHIRGGVWHPPTLLASASVRGIIAVRLLTLLHDSVAAFWVEAEPGRRGGDLRMALSADGTTWRTVSEVLAQGVVGFRASVVEHRLLVSAALDTGDSAVVLQVDGGRITGRTTLPSSLPISPGIALGAPGAVSLFAVGPYGTAATGMPTLSEHSRVRVTTCALAR